jgi:phenylpyruvate tautomerase PptA (4-oxalocrotonate tautomerase family)
MPMIDVYAAEGTFPRPRELARNLATRMMAIEEVPDIPLFRHNTAAFVHHLPADHLSNVSGSNAYVRVQVLTNQGALDRDRQLAVVRQLTDLIAEAAGDPSLTERTWVLLTEAPNGGWGLAGHAHTNDELLGAARAQLAEIAGA